MTLDELDLACHTLFGKGVGGYGINQKLANVCKCSESAVRKWKRLKKVPATPAELIRVKVLNKEISER